MDEMGDVSAKARCRPSLNHSKAAADRHGGLTNKDISRLSASSRRREGVEDRDAAVFEVAFVSRHEGQRVDLGGRRDQHVGLGSWVAPRSKPTPQEP